ncbi:MAG TPA: rhodanese-like domain-containing protein [Gaiellaceae bacterium]|nr:rhodanese-like domain-containing protein [Gaiellaceae bacterium]
MGLFSRTPSIDPAGLAEQLAQRTVYVLDVRQPAEWRHGHIRGSHNVPLMHLKSHLGMLPRNKPIVTVCASGHRSNIAARTLRRNGFGVENLKGGMHSWTKTSLPVEQTRR